MRFMLMLEKVMVEKYPIVNHSHEKYDDNNNFK